MEYLRDDKTKKDIVAPLNINPIKSSNFQIMVYNLKDKFHNQEKKYLQVLKQIYEQKLRLTRYDKSFYYIKDNTLSFNILNELPILTTRNIQYQKILEELIEDFSNNFFDKDSLGFRLRCNNKQFTGPGEYTDTIDMVELFLDQSIRSHNMFTIFLNKIKCKPSTRLAASACRADINNIFAKVICKFTFGHGY